jgi:uncharacterized membrane protein
MKRIILYILAILFAITSNAASHNDYMDGRGVAGATDYVLQWVIVGIILIAIIYIVVVILNIYYKHVDKQNKIAESLNKAASNISCKPILNNYCEIGGNLTYEKHTITLYSSDMRILRILNKDSSVIERYVPVNLDDVEFDEDNDYIENIDVIDGEPLSKIYPNAAKFEILPCEDRRLQDFAFEISERYLPPMLSKKNIKLVKHPVDGYTNLSVFAMDYLYHYNAKFKLTEI